MAASIQESAQPVAPSDGTTDPIGNLASVSALTWYGQPAPSVTSPFLNAEISCEARPQYFLISGRWSVSSLTDAWNCGSSFSTVSCGASSRSAAAWASVSVVAMTR